MTTTMIPAGYMAKRVTTRPDWIKAERLTEIYSVSHCMSADFSDYVNYWKHNGYWFFDSPQVIQQLAIDHTLDLASTKLFYYEVYDREFDDGLWKTFQPEASFKTEVVVPARKALEGYDIVTFSVKASAECSPLSCNGLADEIETNQHCLLESLERAQRLLEDGKFKNSEPGPYRILAVYSADWP
jgi:hypothetical protein